MKKLILLVGVLISLVRFAGLPARAAEAANVQDQLKALVSGVQTKLREGKKAPMDLASELRGFEELLARHKDDKTDSMAEVLLLKAMLFAQVFDQDEAATNFLHQLKRDYPETPAGKFCDDILAWVVKQADAKKVQRRLGEGTQFPDFDVKDLDGKPLSVASYRGKVVLVHFWSTRYPQCFAELPYWRKAYEEYHAKGFEMIGVCLDQDPQRLKSLIQDQKMPWPQFCDGNGWDNKLAIKYGVNSLPFAFLLDRGGRILGKDIAGESLGQAIPQALANN